MLFCPLNIIILFKLRHLQPFRIIVHAVAVDDRVARKLVAVAELALIINPIRAVPIVLLVDIAALIKVSVLRVWIVLCVGVVFAEHDRIVHRCIGHTEPANNIVVLVVGGVELFKKIALGLFRLRDRRQIGVRERVDKCGHTC